MLACLALQDPHHLLGNWNLWDFPKGRKDPRVNQGFQVSQE